MPNQSSITFRPTLRDVMGRFVRADAAMLENKRKAARILGRRWVEIAQEEAPRKTGDFAASIRFRTFATNREVGFTTSSMQPLGTFIIGGTRPHRIQARAAGALYFFWGKVGKFTVVPKSGGFGNHVSKGKLWIGKGYVNHPGTRANPYIERAYVRWLQDMDREVEAVADHYIIDVVGTR